MSLLSPKKRKYRKQSRGRNKGTATRGTSVAFGEYGMKIVTNTYITNRQLEAARKVLVRYVRKVGKMRIRMFPDVPYTKLALEMPMGKGKGDIDTYRIRVPRGKVLFEISGVSREVAELAFKQAAYKLPCQIRLVEKHEIR